MLRFLFRNQLHPFLPLQNPLLDIQFLQYPYLKFLSTISESPDSTHFTRDYLINTCGLSPETALSASQKITIKSPDKPNSVINFFKTHGFSNTHITQIVSKRPKILHTNPNTILKPKIEFLQSLGFSGPSLVKLVSSDPSVFMSGLSTQLMGSLEYIKGFVNTDNELHTVMKRSTWVLRYNLDKIMEPNVAILRNLGVPESNIPKLLLYNPRVLMAKTEMFSKNCDVVKDLGFDPMRMMFLHALRIMTTMSNTVWERKLAVYQEFGFSKEDTLEMFRKQPVCMTWSEKKIAKAMDFFLNVLKWKPSEVSSNASFLGLSLEARIIPRCAVFGVLNLERGVKQALKMADKQFMDKYVSGYQEKVPDVVKAYKGKIEFRGFGKVSLLR